MAVKFQWRRGTAALWQSVNPLLMAGEPGVEIDTLKYKFGDGVHNWNDLPYGGPRGIFPIAAALEIGWDEDYPSNFSQISYDLITGKITQVDIYDSSAMAVHIFSKAFSYNSNGKLSQVVITHLREGSIMTKTIAYTSDGKIASVTRNYSP